MRAPAFTRWRLRRFVDNEEERLVDVDYELLSAEALRGLVEEFITREGTEYGHREFSLDDKVRQVEHQLASGDVKIVFDTVEERANLVPTKKRLS